MLTALLGALVAVCAFGLYTGHFTLPRWLQRRQDVAVNSILQFNATDILYTPNDVAEFEGMPLQYIDGRMDELLQRLGHADELAAEKQTAYNKLTLINSHWVSPSTNKAAQRDKENQIATAKEELDSANRAAKNARRKYETMKQVREEVVDVTKRYDSSFTDEEIKNAVGRSGRNGQDLAAKFAAKGFSPEVTRVCKEHMKRKYNLSD